MMVMHESTFEYLKPTDKQLEVMGACRHAAKAYAEVIEALVPDGHNKQMIINQIRDTAMWVNVAITRYGDGAPRREPIEENKGG